MSARVNTALFTFDQSSPVVSSLVFQRWLKNVLRLTSADVIGIQREFGTRRVYVKFASNEVYSRVVSFKEGTHEFAHEDGTVSQLQVTDVSFTTTEVKIFNVPFEVTNAAVTSALEPFCKVRSVYNTKFGGEHPFHVDSGIRIGKVVLSPGKHIPSFVYVGPARLRAHVVYRGQPETCAVCNQVGHLRANCPRREAAQRRLEEARNGHALSVNADKRSWADIVEDSMDTTPVSRHATSPQRNTLSAGEQPASERPQQTTPSTVSTAGAAQQTTRPASGKSTSEPEQTTTSVVSTGGQPSSAAHGGPSSSAAEPARLHSKDAGCGESTECSLVPPPDPVSDPAEIQTPADTQQAVQRSPEQAPQEVGHPFDTAARWVADVAGGELDVMSDDFLLGPLHFPTVPSTSTGITAASSHSTSSLPKSGSGQLSYRADASSSGTDEGGDSSMEVEEQSKRPYTAAESRKSRRKRLKPTPNLKSARGHRKRSS